MPDNALHGYGGLAPLLRHVRYEVLPTKATEHAVCESVPKDVTVTVTASPAKGKDPTIRLAERLATGGYRVVPHLAARLVADKRHLKEIVDRLTAAGVDDVFVPAGDVTRPAGRYDAALPMMADLTDLGRPFAQVGITGYPEGHPAIFDDVLIQAMWDKRRTPPTS